MWTYGADEPLREDSAQRCGDTVRFDSQIPQTHYCARRIVRVQSGQDEVARLGSLDGDMGGLRIADLANENDVRILPQHRSQRRCERQVYSFVHLHLRDTGHPVFDWVFDSFDCDRAVSKMIEARIEGGGLAGPGRAGREKHLSEVL
jgi:hypothetical protein